MLSRPKMTVFFDQKVYKQSVHDAFNTFLC